MAQQQQPKKCSACKQLAVVNKQHLYPNCLQRAYCSAACVEAGKKAHRKECPDLAFGAFWMQYVAV